ncbi:hypothetical protein A3715_10290 [Oleiphilus sp. HI0009]|nr:hypothetical protein A3715_20625 [Oleiphilus sp. HI0009]KZX78247.1 hypothetical protein A3715_10290 [Oleiphilus sp. HI0009]
MKQRIVLGTPINPLSDLDQLGGNSFCVSYYNANRVNLDKIISKVGHEDILLLDNGAFSHWRKEGVSPNNAYWCGYTEWAGSILNKVPEAVAVVPDVIDGSWIENRDWTLEYQLHFNAERLMVVWHLNEPLELLADYIEMGFGYIGFGSTNEFGGANNKKLHMRLQEALDIVDKTCEEGSGYKRPWIHMLRFQQIAWMYTFNSSDSTNIAINHNKHRYQDNHLHLLVERLKQKSSEVFWDRDDLPRNKAFSLKRLDQEMSSLKNNEQSDSVSKCLEWFELCLKNEFEPITQKLKEEEFSLLG